MKKSNIIEKSMKKLLLVSLLLLLLPCFAFGASPPIATSKVKAIKPGVKSMKQTPKGLNQKMALKAAMKITAITFKTNASGDWTFLYDYENTGFVTFAPHQLQFKSTQILTNNMRVPIHTVTYNTSNPPGTKSGAHSPWNRCSKASKLMLEIVYKGKVLDTKTVNVPPVNVRINNLSSLNGKFKASLKNNTNYIVKVAVRTISKSPLQSGGSTIRVGAETIVIVPKNSSKTCTGVIADKGQNTALEVLFKDEKKCSGKGYIILDTKALPAAAGSILSTSPKVKMLKKDLPAGLQNGPLKIVFQISKADVFHYDFPSTGRFCVLYLYTTKNMNTSIPNNAVSCYLRYYEDNKYKWEKTLSGTFNHTGGNALGGTLCTWKTESFSGIGNVAQSGTYYQLDFSIANNKFVSETGVALDGDNDGTPGGWPYKYRSYYGKN
ncbi:MAG: hypothetical protein K8R67_12815 [Desulfobacteraceae bacterium]|nr:hypothetical protein [Desulfobacteraceae bacterium]